MFRFSNRLLSISVLALALGTGAAQAQKFAIINMQQAVLATSDGKKAAQAINTKFTPVKAEIDKLAKEIQDKQDAFTKNRATMTPAAATDAQRELENLTTDLKRKQEDAQYDLADFENKQLGSIVPKLQQVINEYAAAHQITFVIDTSANPNNLIYGDVSLNIIAPVLAAYEKAPGTPAAAPSTGASKAPAPGTTPAAAPKTAPKTSPAPAPKPAAPGK
jgi:Skp family chaperone for outer membrane proteins